MLLLASASWKSWLWPRATFHGRFDELGVDIRAVSVLGNVALGQSQLFQEALLQGVAEKFLGQLHHASGILDHLHRFDAREFVEEPAATGVHQHGVTLQFKQFPYNDAVGPLQVLAAEIARPKSFETLGRPV